jgi:hypothetical protein
MNLSVHWANATRCGAEKSKAEQTYKDRLLDLFGNADKAFDSKQEWHRQHEPVMHPWQLYNIQAHVDTCREFLPSEKHLAHFIVRFEQ